MKHARQITLTDDERRTLDRWTRGRRTPARLVLRAKIVLLAADEMMNKDIADSLATAAQNGFAVVHAVRRTATGGHRKRRAARRTGAGSANANRPHDHRENDSRKARRRDALEYANLGQGVGHVARDGAVRSGLPTNSNRIGPRRSRSATIRILPRSCLTWWGCISILPNTLWCFARTKRLRSKRWIGRNAGCRFIEAVVAR